MKLLLDTNAYSALRRGDAAPAAAVRGAGQVLVSAVVLGELLYGFRHGSRYAQNIAELHEFLRSPYVSFSYAVPMSASCL